ncbi:c-type cytochrome [Paucibacter sp. DJ2R-2]|uniref:c-type cytochrome n=1 Tax=Paucibacter sp. DJ2R-2 TaxID=2893558 RepID=UPI0021E4FFDC|nr:cytochrome c [Paucibacter sp. DJ2R-2]MCV2438669.1 cytochrome c [Paucibacter sp. DJ2R-2]
MKKITFTMLAVTALGVATTSHGATGAELLKSQCVACHAVTKPAEGGLERLLQRKGPDLYYAGNKFNRDWLTAWLQQPTVLRPGGATFANAVKASDPGTPDVIDAAKLIPHPKLNAADATAAADALMALTTSDLVTKGAFKGDPVNASMAALLFNKLRGCASCHSAKPGSGGSSGVELLSAGERLQPDYVVEYIRNPQKFEPHIWMPKLDLTDADVQKLTGYINTLKQGGAK